MKSEFQISLPAEWHPQSAVLLVWPHKNTDWQPILDEVVSCFVAIVKEIVRHEKVIIVCPSEAEVRRLLGGLPAEQLIIREISSNDTWARDLGPVSIQVNDTPYLLDFTFNGWGLKFPANYDNQITKKLYDSGVFAPKVRYQDMQQMVLEGGSIESDGHGTLLTTAQCLLSVNRNHYKSQAEIEDYLQMIFGVEQILWLHHGYLVGDDTDSHVDTLARFCNPTTIAYVQCTNIGDEHFAELSLMEQELQTFRTLTGEPYTLIPLPMATPIYDNGGRLPATYANFLIINEAVLMPTYHSTLDEIAKAALQTAFPDREIIGINCNPLIKQHGSLHCVTMQVPEL